MKKYWKINNLKVIKKKQALLRLRRNKIKVKKDVENSSRIRLAPAQAQRQGQAGSTLAQQGVKNKENNQDLLLKINKGEGDNALLETELKKASITFYPGGRLLSD